MNGKGELIQGALREGVELILHHHPRFRGKEGEIGQHVDPARIRHGVKNIEAYIAALEQKEKRQFTSEERAQITYNQLVTYVASGSAFDGAGKELVLRQSLEERARKGPRMFEARTHLKGEQYLDQVTVAFRQLYQMFKSGDYAERMPELARAVTTVYDQGFLSPAADLLRHYGLIDGKRYALLKKNIHTKVKQGVEETTRGMEQYGIEQPAEEQLPTNTGGKVTAVALGAVGVGTMVFSSMRFTGSAVGVSFGTTLLPLAGILLCVAAWLVLGQIRRSGPPLDIPYGKRHRSHRKKR